MSLNTESKTRMIDLKRNEATSFFITLGYVDIRNEGNDFFSLLVKEDQDPEAVKLRDYVSIIKGLQDEINNLKDDHLHIIDSVKTAKENSSEKDVISELKYILDFYE